MNPAAPKRPEADARWDIAVVGAGPGGAVTARLAALAGAKVLLIDRKHFPRDKVCGGCLSGRTLEHLSRLGLAEDIEDLGGIRLAKLCLRGWGRRASITLPDGLSVSRRALDDALARAAVRAGAVFLQGHAAQVGPADGGSRRLRLSSASGERSITAAVVIDAAGLGSRLLPDTQGLVRRRRSAAGRIGCGTVLDAATPGFRAGVIHMAVGRGGYVGLVRLEDGRLNVAAALERRLAGRAGPAAAAAQVLLDAGMPALAGLGTGRWVGTPVLRQRPAAVAAERFFAVGDAAGYVEPFTGEGIGWALQSAELLAPLCLRAAEAWSAQLSEAWSALHHKELAVSQRACRAVSWLLGHPLAARAALHVLHRRPAWARPLVRRFHAPRLMDGGTVWT